jgi:hypothetical protein
MNECGWVKERQGQHARNTLIRGEEGEESWRHSSDSRSLYTQAS